jgi:hypothetical protein
MSCCGDRRRTLTQSPARPAQPSAPKPTVARTIASASPALGASSAAHAPVLLRYAGGADIVARGPVTNKAYAFSNVRPIQPVDARDAPILLRSPVFGRA